MKHQSIRRDVLKIAIRFPKYEFPLKSQAIPFNITTTLSIVDPRAPSSYVISAVCSTLWRNYIARPLFPHQSSSVHTNKMPTKIHGASPSSLCYHLVPLFIQVNGGCDGTFFFYIPADIDIHLVDEFMRLYTVRGIDWDKDL